MLCLDTYALIEIKNNNPKYASIVNSDFIIPDLTLAEFYWVLLREEGKEIAYSWYRKFKPFHIKANIEILIQAMNFKYENKR